jgi:hypothetical protein
MLDIEGPAFLLIWVAYHVGHVDLERPDHRRDDPADQSRAAGWQPAGLSQPRLSARSPDLFRRQALFVGFFWAGWTKDRQSWHDRIAGTTVVKFHPALAPAY